MAQQNPDRIVLPAALEIKLDKIIELEQQMIAANFPMVGFEGKQSLSEIREKREEGTLTEEEAEAYVLVVRDIMEAVVVKVMTRDTDYDGDWSYESIRDHLIGPEDGGQSPGEPASINEHIADQMQSLASVLGTNSYAVLHCEQCVSNSGVSNDSYEYQPINVDLESRFSFEEVTVEVKAAEVATSGNNSCVILYVSTLESGGFNLTSTVNVGGIANNYPTPYLILKDNRLERIYQCTDELTNNWGQMICGTDFLDDRNQLPSDYLIGLFSRLENCVESFEENEIDQNVIVRVDLAKGEKEKLEELVEKFEMEQGISARVTIVEEADFDSEVQSTIPLNDVHLVIGKNGNSYRYQFLYRPAFFNYPKSKTLTSGEVITLQYQESEVAAIRDTYLEMSISETGAIGSLTKRPEPTLNIFERGMWVVKTTQELLGEIKVPVPLWNREENSEREYPFHLQALVGGLGDGAIDELKSIPDLILLGLSLFDTEQSRQLLDAITSSINTDAIGKMFSEKGAKYTEQGEDVAYHEGGYDVVQIASMFYGAALIKGSKKAKEAADAFLKVLDDLPQAVKDRLSTFTKQQRDALLKDLSESEALVELMKDVGGVNAWGKLDNWGRPSLKKDIPTLESLQKITSSDKLKEVFDDDFLKAISDAQKTAGTGSVPSMKELFDNIESAFKGLDLSKVKNMDLIKNELKRTDFGKMVGANWTLEYMGKNADLFKGFDEIIFESVEKIDDITGTVIRRVDVKSISKGADGRSVSTFFEFKSVQPPLPPNGFADQFVKDLRLTEVTSLDQLKWVFDGKKVNSLNKSNFMDVLENANISDEVARKLVKNIDNPATDDLLDLIETNFDQIFQIK